MDSGAEKAKAAILADLANFQSHAVADYCLERLAIPAEPGLESARLMPWVPALLLKWVYASEDFQDVYREAPTVADVDRMMQAVWDLQKFQLPSSFSPPSQFLRCIAFQQFYYQEGFSQTDYARQFILFGQLQEQDGLCRLFQAHAGISLSDHMDLSYSTLVMLLGYPELARFTIRFFAPFIRHYGASTVHRFLANMSGDRPRLAAHFASTRQLQPQQEQFEQSPFLGMPLVRWNQFYRVVHRAILGRHLEHVVYDTFKRMDPSLFMNRFGSIFQSYVRRCLSYSGAPFVEDNAIKRVLGDGPKQVDFVVRQETDACVLIDAKGVELAAIAQTATDNDLVYRGSKAIIGGIEQGLATAQLIEDRDLRDPVLSCAKEYFLIIVTFKEMFLRNGSYYAEAIASDSVRRRYEKFPDSSKLPPENIYFLCIYDLELLAELVQRGLTTFAAALRFARNDDRGPPETRKAVFRQHLHAHFPDDLQYPQFVLDAIDGPSERLEAAFDQRFA